jgi:RNA polymerase sigma factor (sigma-70 family)
VDSRIESSTGFWRLKGEIMRDSCVGQVLKEIHALYSMGTLTGLNDSELLARFVTNEGEASQFAFCALVRRHGPMVLRVCQRLLSDVHDCQDAFQATFLILVKKADSLKDRGSVGPWLYGVANRVAAKSRTASVRRARHERQYVERLAAQRVTEDRDQWDVDFVLHDEVRRLPDRLRVPVVLCYIEGLTLEEAAAQLGWPIGTVASRLARARERLRGRLTRRGVVLSSAGLSSSIAGTVSAAPTMLIHSTVKAAISLAEGRAATAWAVPASVDLLTKTVLRSILMTKLKIAGAILTTVGALATSAGVFAYQQVGPYKVVPPAHTESVLEKRESKARFESAQHDDVVFERQFQAAVKNASTEQLVKAALRLGNKEALLRALLSADESREREAQTREKEFQAALNNASKEQLVKAALRLGNKEALLRALSSADDSREREVQTREKEFQAALNNASKEHLVKAALRLGNTEALLRALSSANDSKREEKARERVNED